jgi:serine palmitoyltransferase
MGLYLILCERREQVLTALRVIRGQDGTNIGQAKIDALRNNSNYFRSEMQRIGVSVVGDFDSPVVPVLIYFPGKIAAFSRECLKRGLAVVVVGFPATSVIMSRARFCISAGHTKEDIDFAVKVIEEVASYVCLKYENNVIGY